ncbi:hypothetical protein NEMIN01_2148 [Nematocida minor]|uniref:uncharacterized protein n=1 Tax=Nematocida minor TaxID=1912983 RepID=UPI00221EAF34|nr:uncharacterized protein NEMIN01_2148 [Nematocida minor]KAI5192681.1 hypothetical protein NEMIN01_2148 [Nematocida minor]
MVESVCIKRIKELLGELCEYSLQIMPPQEMDVHPCDWLGEDMQRAVEAIESLRNSLLSQVDAKKAKIQQMEEEKRTMLSALEEKSEKPEEDGLWIYEKSLYTRESVLAKDLAELHIRYEEQKEKFSQIAEKIKNKKSELAEYLENEEECTAVLQEQTVTKQLIERAETLLAELERKTEEIRAKTEEKIKSANAILASLGLRAEKDFSSTAELFDEISQLEAHLEEISSSVESYNYTMNKIDVSDSFTKTASPSVKQEKQTLAKIAPTIHLKSYTEISSKNRIVSGLSMDIPSSKNGEAFGVISSLPYSCAKDLEEKLVRIVRMSEEIDCLLKNRLTFLSNRMEVSAKSDLSGVTPIWRIIVQKEWIAQIEQEYKQKIEEIFTEQKNNLETVLASLKSITEEEAVYAPLPREIKELKFTEQEDILLELEKQTKDAEEEYSILKNIEAFVKERKELLLKMSAFEEQASDPRRLFRSSFQLNSEEKFRKMAVPTLLRVEKEIFALSGSYSEKFGKPVQIKRKEIVTDLKNEISNRIINANTFMTGRQRPIDKPIIK